MSKPEPPFDAAAEHLRTAATALQTTTAKGTRDWAGFFAALAQFFSTIAPVIIPLFKTNVDNKV